MSGDGPGYCRRFAATPRPGFLHPPTVGPPVNRGVILDVVFDPPRHTAADPR
jgi:hypothetical protein